MAKISHRVRAARLVNREREAARRARAIATWTVQKAGGAGLASCNSEGGSAICRHRVSEARTIVRRLRAEPRQRTGVIFWAHPLAFRREPVGADGRPYVHMHGMAPSTTGQRAEWLRSCKWLLSSLLFHV